MMKLNTKPVYIPKTRTTHWFHFVGDFCFLLGLPDIPCVVFYEIFSVSIVTVRAISGVQADSLTLSIFHSHKEHCLQLGVSLYLW